MEQPLACPGLLYIHFVIFHEYLCCLPVTCWFLPEIITVLWGVVAPARRQTHSSSPSLPRSQHYLSDIQRAPHSRRARHVPKCRPSWWPQIMGPGDPNIVGWQSKLSQESPGSYGPAPPPDDRPPPDPDRRVRGRTNLGKMEARGQLLLCLSW